MKTWLIGCLVVGFGIGLNIDSRGFFEAKHREATLRLPPIESSMAASLNGGGIGLDVLMLPPQMMRLTTPKPPVKKPTLQACGEWRDLASSQLRVQPLCFSRSASQTTASASR